jgi:hypothetical protein
LKGDYTDEDIAENMGDVDFANDFADELLSTLTNLTNECKRVSADCIKRKHAMDASLAGLDTSLEVAEKEGPRM